MSDLPWRSFRGFRSTHLLKRDCLHAYRRPQDAHFTQGFFDLRDYQLPAPAAGARGPPQGRAVRLKTRVIALLAAMFATFMAVNYMVQNRVVLPSFIQLEADSARTDMTRVTDTLQRELSLLQVFVDDWGNWSDVYKYMKDQNPDFIPENMGADTIRSANLQLVAFLRLDGRYIWSAGLAPDSSEPLSFQLIAATALPADHPWRRALAAGESAKGIVMTEHGPMMLAMGPALDGIGGGPARGAVLIGRLLTSAELARIADQAKVILDVAKPAERMAAAKAATGNGNDGDQLLVTGDDFNQVYASVHGLSGETVLTLRIRVPRSISAHGTDAIHFVLLSLLIAGLLMLAALAYAINATVLAPIAAMTRHVLGIRATDDMSVRLEVRHADELGILAREFNHMIDCLAQTRHRVVDASYQSGLAEMASGALHNLGNALTPVGVHVTSLQGRLRAAPTAELALVLDELSAGVADPARRADLQEFLRLLAGELATTLSAAGEEAARIADQVRSLQEILGAQARFSRAGPVLETVTLPQVISRAMELVPTEKLARLDVKTDASVARLGTLRLARIVLQQVFQNLLVNAAEAARPGLRVAIQISATEEGTAEAPRLHIVVSDNGAGIAPDVLAHLFEKGYSTKSTDTNSGIGLHWCANVVAGLGGSVNAQSDGPDTGARFHIVLPLQRPEDHSAAMAA
jgi:signal transduction histidine kinase